MTKQERAKIVSAVSERIRENGSVRLNQLSRVFQEEEIDRGLYAGAGPKRWLAENFREFCIEGNNGMEVIRFSKGTDPESQLEQMREILCREIEQKGQILLSAIPGLLLPHGIQYKELSHGRKLPEWLPEVFPQFVVSEDNHRLLKREDAPSASLQGALSEPVLSEIQQMHAMAFMNWWSVNNRRLKSYSEDLGSEEQIKARIAHRFAEAVLGVPGILFHAGKEEEPRIALDTGMKSKEGDPIYCVLILNPKNQDGTKQKWALEDFACAQEENELGKWLKQHVSSKQRKGRSFFALDGKIRQIKRQREELLPVLRTYLLYLEQGRIPREEISGQCVEFERSCAELQEIFQQVWGKSYPEEFTLEQIAEQIGEQDLVAGRVIGAVESFESMLDKVVQLFTQYKLPVGEDATLQKDRRLIRQQYGEWNKDTDLKLFEETLEAYEVLRQVLSATVLTEEVEEQIEQCLCPHFPEISYRFAVRVLMGAEEAEWAFLKETGRIEKTIRECAQRLSETGGEKKEEAGVLISGPEDLWEPALQAKGDKLLLAEYAEAIYPEDPFEGMLIRAKTEELIQDLDLKGSKKAEFDGEKIREAVTASDFPMELTYYGAARRLLRGKGAYGPLAEMYLLLGLASGESSCVQVLLQMYRETEQKEWFRKVFSAFVPQQKAELADQLYYLLVLCEESPAEAARFAHSNYYLLYLEESLRALLELPVDFFAPGEKEKLQERLCILTETAEKNLLECAITEGDFTRIREIVKDRGLLGKMGYSEEEMDRITQAAEVEEEEKEGADSLYEIGARLYAYQGNRRGMAERYLWRGIAEDRQVQAARLLSLLARESRWQECRALYECFETGYAENESCRQLYMTALLHDSPKKAQEYIQENLRDCLLMLHTAPLVRTTVQQLLEAGKVGSRSFFEQWMALTEFLKDPFIRSVIFMDRMLREYAEPARARELGLPEYIVNSIKGIYKSDAYAHGMDAVSISERSFQFFGGYKGVSEAFAKFALPEERAVRQLWKIYSDLGEEQQQFALMQNFSQIREKHRELYLKILFRKEQYAEFLTACKEIEDSPGIRLQIFVARMKVEPKAAEILPDMTDPKEEKEILGWMKEWGSLLTSTLAERGRLTDMENLFFTFFRKWVEVFSEETLRQIITARGTVSDTQLVEIQENALSDGQMELALYLYHVLHIGQLHLQSQAFLNQKMEEAGGAGSREKLQIMQKLRVIYGKELKGLDAQIAVLRIQRIKEDPALTSKEAMQEIGQVLQEFPADGSEGTEIFSVLEDTEYSFHYPVYTNLADWVRRSGKEQEGVRFFHRMAAAEKGENRDAFYGFLCHFDIQVFVEGKFPMDVLPDARELCMRYIRHKKPAEGILCLYFVEKYQGRKDNSDYLLRMLAEQSVEMTGEKLGKIISDQIRMNWGSTLPGYYDLFREVLSGLPLKKVEEYIRFASLVSGVEAGSAAQLETIVAKQGDKIMSENDSDLLLKCLYAAPEDAVIWRQCTKLPLEDNPAAYAKLKFIASRYDPELWQECVDYCEKYEQFDLLLCALYGWAAYGTADSVAKCRKYLEQRLTEKPDYFAIWKGAPRLLEVARVLCRRTRQVEKEYHALLRALSLIVIKTGFPEALQYLLDQFGDYLFGDACNLGFAIAAYLMFEKRFAEAHRILTLLTQVVARMNYRELVTTLSGMSPEELERWLAEPENEMMLRLVLPDGNRPGIEQINAITCQGIRAGRAKETARVLLHVLTMFPNDYGVYNALFDLCCTKFDGYLVFLHSCLEGLVRLQPGDAARFFYRRTQKQYADMLAVLDAVLIQNNQTDLVKGYDFSVETGEYFRRVGGACLRIEDAAPVSERRNSTLLSFKNRSEGETKRRSRAYLCCITGNWQDFLEESWKERTDIRQEIGLQIGEGDEAGFARSVLKVLVRMQKEERGSFLNWLKEMTGFAGNVRRIPRWAQINFVVEFVEKGYFDRLEKREDGERLYQILQNPFEDYGLYSFFLREINQAVQENQECLLELVLLVGSLVCHSGFQGELSQIADTLFEEGNDQKAEALYDALCRMNVWFQLVHVEFRPGKSRDDRSIREEYKARYRITALFQNRKDMVEKVGSADFPVWSCLNMVLTLLYSRRADEVGRLSFYLSPGNAKIADAVLRGFNHSIEDQEKLELINSIEEDVAKAYFCFVLKYPYNPYKKPDPQNEAFALTDRSVAEAVNSRYVALAKRLAGRQDGSFRGMLPAHTLLVENQRVDTGNIRQKDPRLWALEEREPELRAGNLSKEPPFFARGMEAIYETADMESLLQEHESLPGLIGNFQVRRELSERIYRHSLGMHYAEIETEQALLLLGVDSYYDWFALGEYETANRAVLALAVLLQHSHTTGMGSEAAKNMIRSTALFELLRFPDSLDALLSLYSKNRQIFHYMRELMADSLLSSCIGQIYSVLDHLKSSHTLAVQSETGEWRKELSESYRQLEKIETNRWMELKNKVQKLINDEINELDRRPVLRVEVLNQGIQRNYGYLYGQVCNIGQVTAEKIVLQANYQNNSHSRQYVLDALAPGGKAVFEVDYGSAPGTKSLEYYLNAAFSYKEKSYTFVAAKGEMQFGEIKEPAYPTGILCRDPNGMNFAVDKETGEVYNPEFFGRKKETAELRTLVEGEDFAAYRSALVYGIRRTGKTSLLNYLETYIQAHRPKIVCVKADCQDMPALHCVQYIFIDHVIDRIERQLPEVKSSEYWGVLKNTWYTPNFCADRQPEKLSLFYTDLKQILGEKGLYLIIDEIDRLFERVEESQDRNHRNLDNLFGALSGMLNSLECKKGVHFVICGSNWLIRYNLKGDKMNQLFQRFGKQVIEVGKLPETDARDVICTPYRSWPELTISEEALDWIWNYIGGLVWHTKLLGEEAVRRAKADSRKVVYPSDVQQCLPKVLSEQWCKQFYEGCERGEEHQVVDAMQSLAAKRDMYIHVNRISEMLQWETLDVERSMVILKALKVVEQHPIDQQLYRFEQDIYRRYFRTTPSAYSRIPEEPDVFQDRQQVEDTFQSDTEQRIVYDTVEGNGNPPKEEGQPVTEELKEEELEELY